MIESLLFCLLPAFATAAGDAAQNTTPAPQLTTHNLDGQLEYDVLRPASLGPGDEGPVLLALPPGGQDRAMVNAGFQMYWREEALRLGWTVIAPVAPAGGQLFGENLDLVQDLIEHVEATYNVEGGKLHLAGISNGGRSAFELALREPGRFASMSVMPGAPAQDAYDKLESIAALPLAMYVGGADDRWRAAMTRVDTLLREAGSAPVRFTIYEGEGHTPKSLDGKTVFRTLEALRVRAALVEFHDAASRSDAKRYFGHFAEDAVYLGTDATERWSFAEFKAFAAPYFARGEGWTYVPRRCNTTLSPDGQTAWFDELLDNASYGLTRSSGVFVRTDGRWLLKQYHLTIPVPNSLARTLVDLIRAEKK